MPQLRHWLMLVQRRWLSPDGVYVEEKDSESKESIV
jgi:hypothetical protein